MEKRKDYESAKIELVYLEANDVIATSSPLGNNGDGWAFDMNGWT